MSSVVISGDTSGAITVSAPLVAGTNTLTLQAATATNAVNTLGTAVAYTSFTTTTYNDFTSIPSWVKKITVLFYGISTNNTSNLIIQVGSGSIATSGYSSAAWTTNVSNANSTTAFLLTGTNAAVYAWSGFATICLVGSNVWVLNSSLGVQSASAMSIGSGNVALGGTLDRVRISSVTPDTFDGGTVNLLLEG